MAVTYTVTGSDVTLTTTQYASNEARQRMLKITGTLTLDVTSKHSLGINRWTFLLQLSGI
jgi:hypothetical protein